MPACATSRHAGETPAITIPTTRIPHTLRTQPQQGEAGYPTEHVLTPPPPLTQQPPEAQPPSCSLLQQHSSRATSAHPRRRSAAAHTHRMWRFPSARAHLNLISGRCPPCSAGGVASPAWLAAAHQLGHLLTHLSARGTAACLHTELHRLSTCSKPAWNQHKCFPSFRLP